MSKHTLCGHCKHFTADTQNLQQGICHRLPPQVVVPAPGQVISVFPAVQRSLWCSEGETEIALA